jgi:hypothetical protein
VPVTVTSKALEVLRRALEAARLDAATTAISLRVTRGGDVQTGFADEPDPGEQIVDEGGIRIFVPTALAEAGAVVDVSDEHDRIVVRRTR